MTEPVWVLEDPRAGTANQALGIAERLGVPFRKVPLRYRWPAKLPWPWPTVAGLAERSAFVPPWPQLAISAGRRAAPASRWLRARGVRTVHCMRPGFGAEDFDLLVIGEHDAPRPAPNLLPIRGATHRITPERLAAAPPILGLDVALLLGGPVRGAGLDPATAVRIARGAAALGRHLFRDHFPSHRRRGHRRPRSQPRGNPARAAPLWRGWTEPLPVPPRGGETSGRLWRQHLDAF
jgi:mitochondrial fission protein ELM1